MGVYAEAIEVYHQAGWRGILPVPAVKKWPPPGGYTGNDGIFPTPETLVAWSVKFADRSVALRMPLGIIGIDVDHYDKVNEKGVVQKRGAETLAGLEERWGKLPATWCSTARGTDEGPGPSCIRFFRVPEQRYVTDIGDAIEIVQYHHRYAVVAPSINPDANNQTYRWYDPAGAPSELPPKPDELPELPERWVEGLHEGASEAGPAASDKASGQSLLDALWADESEPCAQVYDARLTALQELEEVKTSGASRYETLRPRIHRLVMEGAKGHPGVGAVLAELKPLWEELVAGEGREHEFDNLALGSARKACTEIGRTEPVDRDPCLLARGFTVQAPAPGSPANAEDPDPIEEERFWSIREVIGAHPFDPQAVQDQTLAQAVLERFWPGLRYATDSGSWVVRGPWCWETRRDLAKWAVAEVAWLMPRGDLNADPHDLAYAQAKRQHRFMDSGASGKIAQKMTSLVAGEHICSLRLSDLDSEPDFLWAGGRPWDLRSSRNMPLLANIDPNTPHLHSAAVEPVKRPTPLWDAFVAAVWPDPELRAWALRVLSIALTGYADRALVILLGETGRGKSQVIELLMSVLGSYAHAADPRLLGNSDNTHASITYALKGRRLSFIDEGPREGRWAQERLKQLTGGTQLTGNAMRENPITFSPTHTLVLTANDEPVLTDPAIRARLRLIPCEGDPEEVRRTRSAIRGKAWQEEAPGVLAAMMAEAAAWLADPHSAMTAAAPERIRYRAEEIAAEQDPVRAWVDAETEPYEQGTQSNDLYQAFRVSAQRNGVSWGMIPSATKWGRELTRLGYPSARNRYGKLRPLRLRGVTGWPSVPPPLEPEVRDRSAPDVTGGDGSKSQQVTPENPRSTPTSSSDVTSVTSSSLYRPNITKNTKITNIQTNREGGQEQSHEVSVTTLAPSPAKESGAVTSTAPKQSQDPPPSDPASQSPRVTKKGRLTPEERERRKAERKAAKDREKAEQQQAKIDEASGDVVGLPAVVNRDGTLGKVLLDAARATVARAADRSGALTVDVETTGYPVGHRDYRLRTIQLGDMHEAAVFDASDPDHQQVVRELLASAPKLHAHSATADLVPLDAAGLLPDVADAWSRMHDTVIPAKLSDPKSTGSDPGLKELSGVVLGDLAVAPAAEAARANLFKAGKWLTKTEIDTPTERSGWAQVDSASTTMVRYAASDVLDTAALAVALPDPDPRILERERSVQRITARVTHRGLRIDGEHVAQMIAKHTTDLERAAKKVRSFGVREPGSDQQLAAQLQALRVELPATKTGRPSVAKDVLEKLQHAPGEVGGLVNSVLHYRHSETVLGLFLKPYQHLVEHGDGRVRPTVYSLGTDTGRMSCVRPNLQQLPREGGVRACITADPGYTLISADFSSVEIRVAAALSGDVNLRRMIDQGVDLHWEIAKQVWGPNATKANRYTAKRIVFGRIYGGGISTLAKQSGVTEAVVQAAVDALDALTPELAAWSRQVRDMVQAGATQFPSYSGRIIHLPQDRPYAAPNYCLATDTPILRSDLQHVAALNIKVGDRLVAFDEYPTSGKAGVNKYHHMRTAVVEATSLVQKPSVVVRTADGKATTCSRDHLWLVRPKVQPKGLPRIRWVKAEDLLPDDVLLSLGTWQPDTSHNAGYLAGLYDGEGCLTKNGSGRRKNQLAFSQNRGPVIGKFCSAMDELGLPYSYYDRSPNSTTSTDTVMVNGMRNVMRVLGTLQPYRFRGRFEEAYEGNAVTAGLTQSVAVVEVVDAGMQTLVSIQTSTRTLVANGYLSHNCIQGSARELLVDGLLRWQDTRWGGSIIVPVHDEILAMVLAEEAEAATAELSRCMSSELNGIPITAEASAPSFAWADSV